MAFDQSNRRGDRTLRVAIGALIVLGVAVVIAFLWVWVPTWRLDAGSYANARSYWLDFAAPRAALSLVAGVPLGLFAAVVADRRLKRALHP